MNQNAAVAYIRVSTQEQAQHGVSLDAQEARIRAYATMQGLEIVAVVREEGVSASKALSSRPGGQELLSIVASGVRNVIALKLDRLFRDAADCLNQTRAWDRADVAMHLVDMNGMALSTGSAMGRMFLTMAAGFAELERNLISERTKTALSFKREQGVILGRPRLTADADDAGLVARLSELRAEGRTLRAMAAALEAEGFQTAKGGRWAPETIRKILARQEAA